MGFGYRERGSSPLTRGKRYRDRGRRLLGRLIPTHAGKTNYGRVRHAGPPAHPHSRGENHCDIRRHDVERGSSPLTRGKPHVGVGKPPDGRLIPTHAGKTSGASHPPGTNAAHPHSRGENSEQTAHFKRSHGSSPLTRGKPINGRRTLVTEGLIPTHAGKTRLRHVRPVVGPAHPHSRGENGCAAGHDTDTDGSSPLTRGKRGDLANGERVERLIPTHAGKTRLSPNPECPRGAHPHSRGENRPSVAYDLAQIGSSPLTRGKRMTCFLGFIRIRLIPTHAGKTRGHRGCSSGAWAHPHSRGENEDDRGAHSLPAGSSPLTRGKHRDPASAAHSPRLIPTHAGKTGGQHRHVSA